MMGITRPPDRYRVGGPTTIVPARGSLTEAVAALRRLPKPSEVERREPIEPPEREG
jgi:hypothetical protein